MVVVRDVLPEGPLEMALALNEHPVEALGPRRPDKALRERVRPGRPDRGLDDPGADRPHHLVKWADELGVPVADQELDGSALVLQGNCQVPGLLGDPGPGRVGRHAGQEYLPALEVDEEQYVEPPKCDGLDMEEVTGEGAGSLGSKELRPRRT
jgi:hypothetical protein